MKMNLEMGTYFYRKLLCNLPDEKDLCNIGVLKFPFDQKEDAVLDANINENTHNEDEGGAQTNINDKNNHLGDLALRENKYKDSDFSRQFLFLTCQKTSKKPVYIDLSLIDASMLKEVYSLIIIKQKEFYAIKNSKISSFENGESLFNVCYFDL